jgi:drug/metabolite transporter (DMT)-like permease
MVALVLSTVLIQIVVAILLKQLADFGGARPYWLVAGIIAAAAGLNGIRFLVWGYTNKHYPLSSSYPLTALFFPCILLVSAAYGEPVAWGKVAAVIVIVAGLALTTPRGNERG